MLSPMDENEQIRLMEEGMLEQDKQIIEIEKAVKKIKTIAIGIGEEIDTQNTMLTVLGNKTDNLQNKLIESTSKITTLIKSNSCVSCTTLFIIAALMFLFLLVLYILLKF